MIIDGKKIQKDILTELMKLPRPRGGIFAIYAGNHEPSAVFLRQKEKFAKSLGVEFTLKRYPETVTTEELRKEVASFSGDENCGGIIVQLPLPEHIDQKVILEAVAAHKDVDCLSSSNLGKFFTGTSLIMPPVVGALKSILEDINFFDLKNKKVGVLGSALLVGLPVTHWLMSQAAEVTVLRSAVTEERRAEVLRQMDLVVSGVGKPGLVKPYMVNPGTVVVDFGYPADLEVPDLASSPIIATPTPGGTGPVVVAEVFRNLYLLCK